MATLQKIIPSLWFDRQAEDAAKFYISVFKDSRILRKSYYTKAGEETHKMPEGTVLTIEFELEGQKFTGLNGGPIFKFNEAVSFIVNCDDQQEIDYYWDKLGEGGDPGSHVCGWLKDQFGLSWQVTTPILTEMLLDEDKEKAQRAMNALMQMKKIDIQQLRDAFEGK